MVYTAVNQLICSILRHTFKVYKYQNKIVAQVSVKYNLTYANSDGLFLSIIIISQLFKTKKSYV